MKLYTISRPPLVPLLREMLDLLEKDALGNYAMPTEECHRLARQWRGLRAATSLGSTLEISDDIYRDMYDLADAISAFDPVMADISLTPDL